MLKDPIVEILKTELARKRSRNSSYSLRSFSRDLGLDASNLSKILSYQKPLGTLLKRKIAGRLGFEGGDLELLDPTEASSIADSRYRSHELEKFQVISGWQHYAILELFKLKDFEPSISFMQMKLGLSRKVVLDSLRRLEVVGLLTKDPTTDFFRPTDTASSSILNLATSKAHRDQQREILEGAIDALSDVLPESRSQTSMTMAIDRRRLDEARALITKFRRQMGRLLSSSPELTDVYQLSISLYPLTNQPGESTP